MKRILISDDSRLARSSSRKYLETALGEEADHMEAADCVQALELMKELPPHLLVTDLPRTLLRAISGVACDEAQGPDQEGLLADTVGEVLNTMAGSFMERSLPGSCSFGTVFPRTGRGLPEAVPDRGPFFLAEGAAFVLHLRTPRR